MNENPIEITRNGVYPIFKYTIRQERGGTFTAIFLDDQYGNITLSTDWGVFGHWWGEHGRATNSLRQFLVKAGTGYIAHKFSYGHSGFDSTELEERYTKELEEAVREGTVTEDESKTVREDLVARIEECNNSSDFRTLLHYEISEDTISVLEKMYGSLLETPSGETRTCSGMKHFMKEQWAPIVEFWKKELAEENLES